MNECRNVFTESGIHGCPSDSDRFPESGCHTIAAFHPASSKSFCCHPAAVPIAVFHSVLLAKLAHVPSVYSTTSVAIIGGASSVAIPLGFTT